MGRSKTKIFVVFGLVLVLLSTFVCLYLFAFKDSTPVIEELIVNKTTLNLEIGDTINIDNCYLTLPSNSEAQVMCLLSNTSLANISGHILTAKQVGETKIYLKAEGRDGYIQKEINIKISEKSTLPDDFSFEREEIVMGINTEYVINNIVYDGNHNFDYEISYTNAGIVTYNPLTGQILPTNTGTTFVNVKLYTKSESITHSFKVAVKDIYREIKIDLPKEDDYYILNMNAKQNEILSIIVYEDETVNNSARIVTEIKENGAQTEIVQGEITPIVIYSENSGESIIKISCYDDSSVFILIKVKVV